jgi:hypothetical protein
MASYSIPVNNTTSTTTDTTLPKSTVQVTATVPVYYVVGSDTPQATTSCALLPANKPLTLRLPVKCLKIAVLAVDTPGYVTIVEINGTKASCLA